MRVRSFRCFHPNVPVPPQRRRNQTNLVFARQRENQEDAMNPYAKYLEGRDPLTVAAATPAKIVALIRRLGPRQLDERPAPGKWSIREIISHLADTELVMCCRARWIAFEEKPTLVP